MNGRQLSENQKKLVTDNIGLVYYWIEKFDRTKNSIQYDEHFSNGTLGLIKAALTYEASKKVAFSTYATRCIYNEILQGIRRERKLDKEVSIYENIDKDNKEYSICLIDVLENPKSPKPAEKLANKEELIKIISIILNCLEGREKLAILYRIGGIFQSDIAKKLGISQSFTSKIERKAVKKINSIYDEKNGYKEIFTVEIVECELKIIFSPKDITNFNMVYKRILDKKNKNFIKFSNNDGRIEIRILLSEEYFVHIADIIGEIYGFNTNDISTKVDENHFKRKKRKSITKAEGRGVKSNEIKKYFLTLDEFSVDDLRENFQNMTDINIHSAISCAKRKKLIVNISKGVYKVKK